MRLIGYFQEEAQASSFCEFLLHKGIPGQFEKILHEGVSSYAIWIHREEDLDQAFDYYQKYVLHPEDPFFGKPQKKQESSPRTIPREKSTVVVKPSFSLTHVILIICAILFFWNGRQEEKIKAISKDTVLSDYSLTPLQQSLFFDEPKAVEEIEQFVRTYGISSLEQVKSEPIAVQKKFQIVTSIPCWKGIFPLALDVIQKEPFSIGPLFEKIRQGEVWRLVTPSFMHRDFLHIFFNMAWLLILGKQIEIRLKKPRMLLLILALAVFSNVCQYLMSGAYFLGFSGIITGFAGFIWSRQQKAPWEGYPLHKTTALFLFYFVLILFFVSIACFILQALRMVGSISSIANTAHLSGGILGLMLGRSSFFAKRIPS